MKQEILLVDDEVDNVDALERIFRRDYKVLKATSGAEGLQLLKENPDIALIISDQRMPEMTGVEMLSQSIKTHPEAIRILLTGYTDMDSVVAAVNSGQIYRYLTKPWDPIDLKNTVDKAVEKFNLRRELVVKNRELEAAYNELKGLDQAKTNFMILINHELKTPLTVISSFLELVQETSLDPEQKRYLEKIAVSKNRLQKIIDDVLVLISAETGLTKIKPKSVHAVQLISGLEEQFLGAAEKRGLQLSFSIEDIDVHADRSPIQEVLRRLLENAIKFATEKTKVQVEVRAKKKSVLISVTNQGKGLKTKDVEKILKPFSLDENIMNHSEGLGLGLSLCQALLKAHGSELKIESKKGSFRASFALDLA